MAYTWPSFPVTDPANPAVKFDLTWAHASSIGVAKPWSAKKRIRWPENQVNTSSGVPWRYELIWFWKVPWSTVLIVTLVPPLAAMKSLTSACRPAFGAGSEEELPIESEPPVAGTPAVVPRLVGR